MFLRVQTSWRGVISLDVVTAAVKSPEAAPMEKTPMQQTKTQTPADTVNVVPSVAVLLRREIDAAQSPGARAITLSVDALDLLLA